MTWDKAAYDAMLKKFLLERGINPDAPATNGGMMAPPPQQGAGPLGKALNIGIKKGVQKLLTDGAPVADEAANAAWNESANLASQEAWNQGANIATNQSADLAAQEAWNQSANLATEQAGSQLGSQAAPSVLGNFSSMGFGPQAGIIAGTVMTAQGIKDLVQGKKSSLPTRAVTAMSTFGGSELARALGFGNHKSTKQHQAERWGKIADSADSSDYWKNAAATHAQVMNDKSVAGKWINEKGEVEGAWTLDKAIRAIKAGDARNTAAFRTGALGHQRVIGNEWGTINDDQRDQFIREAANRNLYYGDHGDTMLKKEGKDLFAELLAGKLPNSAPSTAPGVIAQALQRSQTRSPGIAMDGSRFSYSKR